MRQPFSEFLRQEYSLVITYRTFLNSDPPQIVGLWNRQPSQPLRLSRITNGMLESQVFAKLYFDADGFFVACDGEQVVGFAHCAFGPDREKSGMDRQVGIISQLVVAEGQSADVFGN